MKRIFAVAFCLFAFCAVSACTTPGGTGGVSVTAPRTYGQSLLYGYETNAEVRKTATALLQSKLISKADAMKALDVTDTARTALDEARKAGCPDFETKKGSEQACLSELPQGAMAKLNFAVGLARQALDFVNAHKK